jgi:hypothetical protein
VKPTEHIAKLAATPKTGGFALLRGTRHAPGSGAPTRGPIAAPVMARSLITLCVLAVLLALSAAGAQAEPPRLVPYGSSETEGGLGVAVDQSSGDLWTAGLIKLSSSGGLSGLGRIEKFDAFGKPLPPSPFAEGLHSGAAVDPTNGNLYVLNASGTIETYDPNTGALLSSFTVPVSDNSFGGDLTVVQIATDSAGNVYVPVIPENKVLEYSPAGTLLQTFAGSGASALKEPNGVAVDASGNLWIADTGNNRLEELSSTGAFVGEIKSEGVRAVALDAHGDVYAIVDNSIDSCGSLEPPCSHLVEFSSAGVQLADLGAGTFGVTGSAGLGVLTMLAVNESSGYVYVTDGSQSRVWIFAPPSAPTVTKELAAEVETSEAKLGAIVNPGGIETTYRVEYGATTSYGQTAPFPEGSAGESVSSHAVWASASGLLPGQTYHYRVVAINELGTTVGADQTFTTETAAQDSCPNEALRTGFSASLPDCRAYELVTPVTTASSQPDPFSSREAEPAGLAARDGNSMSYISIDVLPGSDSGGGNYVSTRGEDGWSSENVTPRQAYTGDRCTTANTKVMAYSPNLLAAVLFAGGEQPAYAYSEENERGGGCGAETVEVVNGEPLGVKNLFLRDNTNASYRLINAAPTGITPENANFDGASVDLSHVVFDEQAPLTSNAPDGADDLYDWTEGGLELVTVLPDGAPVAGSLAASWETQPRVISANGSHIFFTADGKLYVRLNGTQTVQIDASQVGGGGGGGKFQEASVDGSLVFFTDDASADLTSDTVPGSGTNLYLYDVPSGQLTDLTPGGAGSNFEMIGASEDGSYLYFSATAALASGATAGQSNLYLLHDGTTTLIATATLGACRLGPCMLAVSNDGLFFAFSTTRSLPTVNFPSGYDNTDASTGELDNETYLYDVASNELSCASCNPSGEPPAAGGAGLEAGQFGAPHPVSDDGRLFFDTAEALLPRDTNGKTDVYEYEDGQLHLISTGTSSGESALVDTSEGGNDVFFLTRQQLVPQDTHEELRVIYDARVDGGFPAVVSPPPCTTADACRTPVTPQPSIYGAPSSQTFSGAGNLAAPVAPRPAVKSKSKPAKCKRGFVKKQDKCVKKSKKKPTQKAKKSAHANKTGK